jgi:hypothetical protein
MGLSYTPQKSFMLNDDEKNDTNLQPSWNYNESFGLELGFRFKNISLTTGIIKSKQGIIQGKPTAYSATTNLSYLKIPILFNIQTPIIKKFSIIFSGGFQLSILTKAKIIMPYGLRLPGNDKQWFKKATYDCVGYIGIQYEIYDNINLTIGPRIDYSLSDPEDKDHIYRGNRSSGRHWKKGRSSTNNITKGIKVRIVVNITELLNKD